MKKIIALFLACLLLLGTLSGCTDTPPAGTGGGNGDGGGSVGENENQNPSGGNETVKAETLTVAGANISAYTIVYAPAYSAEFVGEFEEFLGEEYEHNLTVATELAELLSETLGITLAVKADSEAETAREILIGATNRAASAAVTASADDAYTLSVVGEKLVLAGGSDGAVYHALDAIETALTKATAKDLAWNAGEILSGKAPLRRIACLGDSITEGSIGGHVTPELAYPAALQRLFWQDAIVYNYGLGGTTMMRTSKNPYMSSQQYADCLANPEKYDLILIMLGTNDAKVAFDALTAANNGVKPDTAEERASAWTSELDAEYRASLASMMAALKAHSPEARFAFMNCPVKYTPDGYGDVYMHEVQENAVTEIYADGYDITLYDMYAYTCETLTQDNFRDGLHPNYAGYAVIAEGVLELVYHLLDGDENEYVIPLDPR